KLKNGMAGHQRHFRQFCYVPCTDDEPPAIGAGFYLFNKVAYLVNGFSISAFPTAPLFAVDRSQFALFVGPFVPDRYAVVFEVLDIGLPFQEPKQFINDAFEVELFGGYQWKSFLEVKPHLVAEATGGACAGTVGLGCAIVNDVLQ